MILNTSENDWTHKNKKIVDIRKLSKLYVIKIQDDTVNNSLFISSNIFEERINQFFLKPIDQISRKEILEVSWNFYITKGYYLKQEDNELKKEVKKQDKFYISYLEIDGPLSSFSNIYKYK